MHTRKMQSQAIAMTWVIRMVETQKTDHTMCSPGWRDQPHTAVEGDPKWQQPLPQML